MDFIKLWSFLYEQSITQLGTILMPVMTVCQVSVQKIIIGAHSKFQWNSLMTVCECGWLIDWSVKWVIYQHICYIVKLKTKHSKYIWYHSSTKYLSFPYTLFFSVSEALDMNREISNVSHTISPETYYWSSFKILLELSHDWLWMWVTDRLISPMGDLPTYMLCSWVKN